MGGVVPYKSWWGPVGLRGERGLGVWLLSWLLEAGTGGTQAELGQLTGVGEGRGPAVGVLPPGEWRASPRAGETVPS